MAIRSKTRRDDGRIVITGTGRAGTTFLVQVFTALGFDTGFNLRDAVVNIDPISFAGLEHRINGDANPYVIKSPWFADLLEDMLDAGTLRIHAAILPMRALGDAAASRCRVYEEAGRIGPAPLEHPGSLWHTDRPEEQEDVLARQFYKAIYPLVNHGVPIHLIQFPRLVQDAAYAYAALRPLMEEHGVEKPAFVYAHGRLAEPRRVHVFNRKAAELPQDGLDFPAQR